MMSETEARILDAAVQLFSRQGFQGTTTREIARLARVNEGTLFRHFARKVDLFWAAVQSQLDKLRLPRQLQTSLAIDDCPDIVLPAFCEFLAESVTYHPELMRLLYFSALELRPGAETVCREQLGPIFRDVSSYLERCVRRSAIRAVEPSIMTAAMIATVLAYGGPYQLLTGNVTPYATARDASIAYSTLWLSLLMPQTVDGRVGGVAKTGRPWLSRALVRPRRVRDGIG